MPDAAAVDKVYAALRATWEELGQEHHDGYIDRAEVEVLTKYLLDEGVRF